MISNQVTAPPMEEPVSLAQAKQHLRVDTNDDDALIAAQITAARQMVEAFTGRVLMRQDRDLIFPAFDDPMRLGAPLASVASISYVDAAGATQTVSPADYVVVAPTVQPEPVGFVTPAYGKSWPSTRTQHNAVTIRAALGYATPDAVPASLRAAMLLHLTDLYENREAQGRENTYQPNPTVARLLFPWVVTWF